jgi:tetratricopeptide (TPR) repeat protein
MSAKGMLAFNYAINRICIKLADDGKPDEAGRLRDKWIKNFNKKYGVNPFSMDQLLAQTNGLANAGMPDKAIRLADEALKVLSNPEAEKSIMAWGRNPSDWKVDFYMIQSDSYKFMSKPKESIAPAQKALEELKRSNADANSNRFLWALLRTGGGYMLNNQMAEAEKYYSEAQQLWRRVSPGYSAESSCILKAVVDFYLTSKQYREAQKLLTECLHGMSNHYRTHLHPSMQEYYNTLGELFYTEKKYKEATLPFKQSVLISKNEHKNDLYYRHALNRLRECYSLLGQNSEAEAYALEYQKASSIAKEKEQHAKPLGKPDKATEPPAAGQKN